MKPNNRAQHSTNNSRRRKSWTAEQDAAVDYKNLTFLRQSIGSSGKILSSYGFGRSRKSQHRVAVAIKRARYVALIPYCESHK